MVINETTRSNHPPPWYFFAILALVGLLSVSLAHAVTADSSVDVLNLSVESTRILKDLGIKFIEDAEGMTMEELWNSGLMNFRAAVEISDAFLNAGFPIARDGTELQFHPGHPLARETQLNPKHLSQRTINRLNDIGIYSLEALSLATMWKLKVTPQLGDLALKEIGNLLRKNHLPIWVDILERANNGRIPFAPNLPISENVQMSFEDGRLSRQSEPPLLVALKRMHVTTIEQLGALSKQNILAAGLSHRDFRELGRLQVYVKRTLTLNCKLMLESGSLPK